MIARRHTDDWARSEMQRRVSERAFLKRKLVHEDYQRRFEGVRNSDDKSDLQDDAANSDSAS